MDARQAEVEINALKSSLAEAQVHLEQQRKMLGELTAAPYAFGVVVHVTDSSEKQGEVTTYPVSFTGIGNNSISADPRITSVGPYILGMILEPKNMANVRREVEESGTVTIVGFENAENIILQLTGGRVVIATEEIADRYFQEVTPDLLEDNGTAIMSFQHNMFEVIIPSGVTVKRGDTVKVLVESMYIVDVSHIPMAGRVCVFQRSIDETFAEVDDESSSRVVFMGNIENSIEMGDRVVLDASSQVIIRNLGKKNDRFRFSSKASVSWEDIGGLHTAKEQLIEAIELPAKHPEIFSFYKKQPIKGILFFGPPGCGKTMLGKAAATSLARVHGDTVGSEGFFYIKGPEILSRYVSVAEATISQVFLQARKHKEVHGFPAVIFIDEADAILGKRGSGISSDMERTIVPTFLTEMDGLEDSGALVILSTNRPDVLDSAIVRDRRIDRKIKIERPNESSAEEIFRLCLKGVPLSKGGTCEGMAKAGVREVFSPKRGLYTVKLTEGAARHMTLANILNGGMITNIVEQASSIAIRRDLSSKKMQGLTEQDLISAVNIVEEENRNVNHDDAFEEFTCEFQGKIQSVDTFTQIAT